MTKLNDIPGLLPNKKDLSKPKQEWEWQTSSGYNNALEEIGNRSFDLDPGLAGNMVKVFLCNECCLDITSYGAEKLIEKLNTSLGSLIAIDFMLLGINIGLMRIASSLEKKGV